MARDAHPALPPGPRLPRLVQSSGVLRFRHRLVPWLHRRYCDVFTVRLLPRGRTTVYFAHPDAVREIFAGDPDGCSCPRSRPGPSAATATSSREWRSRRWTPGRAAPPSAAWTG